MVRVTVFNLILFVPSYYLTISEIIGKKRRHDFFFKFPVDRKENKQN